MRGGRGCSCQPAGRCDVLCAFGGKLVVDSGHCIAQSFSASLPQPFRLLLGSWSPKNTPVRRPPCSPRRQLRLSRESKKRARPMIMMGLAWSEKRGLPCRGRRLRVTHRVLGFGTARTCTRTANAGASRKTVSSTSGVGGPSAGKKRAPMAAEHPDCAIPHRLGSGAVPIVL